MVDVVGILPAWNHSKKETTEHVVIVYRARIATDKIMSLLVVGVAKLVLYHSVAATVRLRSGVLSYRRA